MTKYDILQTHLGALKDGEVLMTFSEIERLLGFPLPHSARRHRAWWANNPSNNVATRAWRNAGRKTARVDMASERVVFIREESPPSRPLPAARFPATLSPAAAHMIERHVAEFDVDRQEAMTTLLNAFAVSRRLEVVDRLAELSPKLSTSSVDLIREERDGR